MNRRKKDGRPNDWASRLGRRNGRSARHRTNHDPDRDDRRPYLRDHRTDKAGLRPAEGRHSLDRLRGNHRTTNAHPSGTADRHRSPDHDRAALPRSRGRGTAGPHQTDPDTDDPPPANRHNPDDHRTGHRDPDHPTGTDDHHHGNHHANHDHGNHDRANPGTDDPHEADGRLQSRRHHRRTRPHDCRAILCRRAHHAGKAGALLDHANRMTAARHNAAPRREGCASLCPPGSHLGGLRQNRGIRPLRVGPRRHVRYLCSLLSISLPHSASTPSALQPPRIRHSPRRTPSGHGPCPRSSRCTASGPTR
ncbi:hypothetical protein SAMN05421505_1073 [Sinosporangium album]|uniref:Uncharacterized protein n=1 Tax=Sinosporangium album TaxID=504805 RepID=A0A1G7WFY4_9ACTN|nr:hypothetical protein SAMN05421505_1073 [Sinosporangium album]